MSTFTKMIFQNLPKTSNHILKINEGITDFEKNVFSYSKDKVLDDIETLELPSTMNEVDEVVLGELTDLTNINVNPNNKFFKSIDGVLYSKDGKKLIKFPIGRKGTFVVPDGVEIIESAAFYLSQIEKVILPKGLKMISNEAFYQCDSLNSIDIPDSVEIIEDKAFFLCDFDNKVELPKNLRKIGILAFSSEVKIEDNDFFDVDEAGNLFDKLSNSLISITSQDYFTNLKGNFEIKSFARF